ncbi:MAG TPA: ribose-phosphate diphosphokinase [Chloroflexi bacterium]|nr:ribose-phosphate diphosphokinase [Chloroflexota bacterium]
MSIHDMQICTGRANQPLAQAVATKLGRTLLPVNITQFPDSEVHVLIEDLVRHQDIYIIQPCSAPVNDHLMELLLMIDAFRRASVHAINVIVPYYPYARQDRMAQGREAISARVVARMIQQMGADRVVYVDIHAQATQGFFDIPVDPLTALPVMSSYFHGERFENAAVVSPDVGRAWLANRYAKQLNLPLVVMYKRRTGDGEVQVKEIAGDIAGKTAILIDDVIASGSVLTQLPELIRAGAKPPIYLAITHPVLLPPALERLNTDIIAELVVTDTIHVSEEKRHPKLTICSIAPLLAEAIRRIQEGDTMGPLVEGTWEFN